MTKQKGAGACLSKSKNDAVVMLSSGDKMSELYSQFETETNEFLKRCVKEVDDVKSKKQYIKEHLVEIKFEFFMRKENIEFLYNKLIKQNCDGIHGMMEKVRTLYEELERVCDGRRDDLMMPSVPRTRLGGAVRQRLRVKNL